MVSELVAGWSAAAWPMLLNHLWQSTLFALVLIPLVLLLRSAPARVRYSLCLVASAKFLLPTLLVFYAASSLAPDLMNQVPRSSLLSLDLEAALSWLAPADAATPAASHVPQHGNQHGTALAAATAETAPAAPLTGLYTAFTVVWLTGSVLLFAWWIARRRAFAAVLATGREVSTGPEAELLERVRQRLGIRRRVRLVLLPGGSEPGVCRIWRPRLVLPEQMPDHLSPAELEAIFVHELVHVQRWDNLVANLHMLLCCLFWFHPVVWLLDRRLLAEREEACDERVVELVGQPETYVRGLLKAVRFGIGWRLAGVSSASASDFRRRIERLMRGGARPRNTPLQRSAVLATVLLLVVFSVGASTSAMAVLPGCKAQAAVQLVQVKSACQLKYEVDSMVVPALRLPAAPPQASYGLDESAVDSSDCSNQQHQVAAREGSAGGPAEAAHRRAAGRSGHAAGHATGHDSDAALAGMMGRER